MKKAIIISGAPASGKTATARAIAELVPDHKVLYTNHAYMKKMEREFDVKDYCMNIKSKTLVIVEECLSADDILSYLLEMEYCPETKFIFITQQQFSIYDFDHKHFQVVQLGYSKSKQ